MSSSEQSSAALSAEYELQAARQHLHAGRSAEAEQSYQRALEMLPDSSEALVFLGNAAQARGDKICNLTVGDFSSKEFPIPPALHEAVLRALAAGETNYPPSDGVLRLREAVREFYRARLQLDVPLETAQLILGHSAG